MAQSAAQIQYRQEFIAGFEQRQTLLRDTTTTEAVIKGNQATFLVADTGGATAVTRGLNGLIPARANNNTQLTATLKEWHDLVKNTDFNIFQSQGDQRAIMQAGTMAVINRAIDQDIITELNTATQDTGAAATASLTLANWALTILLNNQVPLDNNIFGVITPAFRAYLMSASVQFASRDYISDEKFRNMPNTFSWMGVNWLVHSSLPGAGTNAEKCFMYHKSAIGHAVDTSGLDSEIGYDGEQAYSWARVSGHWGSKLLQNSGVVVINHDGSGFAAQ
jgi:hypothetical protein